MDAPDAGRDRGGLGRRNKRRTGADETKQENIIGSPVAGKVALMFDDMISTGSSICGAAHHVHRAGAREIYVAATHALLSGPAVRRLQDSCVVEVAVTNTLALSDEKRFPKLTVLSVADLLAAAIRYTHSNESISQLFD